MGLPFGHLSGRKADIVELSLKPRERVREERESNLGPSAEILPFGRRGREL